MSRFEESKWKKDGKFSQNYLEEADYFLPFRIEFFRMAKGLSKSLMSRKEQRRILDLGCGDGFFIEQFQPNLSDKVVLVDGSGEMLEAAKQRLAAYPDITYIKSSFQELLAKDSVSEQFDLIFSSLSIHHLSLPEKSRLYQYAFDHLDSGGLFINYDVVLASSELLEKSYIHCWREWIEQHNESPIKEKNIGIPDQYKENADNIPDTLACQLNILKEIGYKDVDCFFKYGLFCLFGGKK